MLGRSGIVLVALLCSALMSGCGAGPKDLIGPIASLPKDPTGGVLGAALTILTNTDENTLQGATFFTFQDALNEVNWTDELYVRVQELVRNGRQCDAVNAIREFKGLSLRKCGGACPAGRIAVTNDPLLCCTEAEPVLLDDGTCGTETPPNNGGGGVPFP